MLNADLSRFPLILASRSPRRAQILRDAGFSFQILPAEDSAEENPALEKLLSQTRPDWVVAELAYQKAKNVFDKIGMRQFSASFFDEHLGGDLSGNECSDGRSDEPSRNFSENQDSSFLTGWVLSCDSVAVCKGQILGKPADRQDALRMLRLLSGSTHFVLSGICLWPYSLQEFCSDPLLRFFPLNPKNTRFFETCPQDSVLCSTGTSDDFAMSPLTPFSDDSQAALSDLNRQERGVLSIFNETSFASCFFRGDAPYFLTTEPIFVSGQDVDSSFSRKTISQYAENRQDFLQNADSFAAAGFLTVECSELKMDDLSESTIQAYLDSGLWQGKAGAFGYQDGNDWLQLKSGTASNVVGLPLERLIELLGLAEKRS